MRILVCGGRTYHDFSHLESILDKFHQERGITVLIQGCARGADSMAKFWAATTHGIEILDFPALWAKYGPGAGAIRNKQMIDEGKPDVVIAFPGGAGTRNMVSQARAAGIEVIEISEKE